MKYSANENLLTLWLAGRIDSANAAAVEKEIETIRSENPSEGLVLDLEELEYISSAGLRIILRLRKAVPLLKLVNVSPEIYDIFDMTGFTELMTVERAYRKLSMEGLTFIAGGSNGKVYRLDDDTIIKVYRDANALPDIQRERELARKAFIMGIPTAIPYDVVKVGDSYGSVFELLNAKSLSALMNDEPENFEKYVRIYAGLLQTLHATRMKPGELSDMRDTALKWARFLRGHLPEESFEKLLSLVEALPENDRLLHGDFHIGNVMMQNGEALIIDMDTLCVGDPVFEFGTVYLACIGFTELSDDEFNPFLGISNAAAAKVWDRTLELYFAGKSSEAIRRNEERAKIVGYTRLMRRTIKRVGYEDPEGSRIIENCKKNLIELLRNVDSLPFE